VKKAILIGSLVLFFFSLNSLLAAEKGSVSGVVKNTEGQILANAKVRISGDLLPEGREYITGKDGAFRFFSLLPGRYKLEITHPEAMDFAVEVIISLDKDTQVQAVMTPVGRVTEEVVVTAVSPLVDLKSTEVAINWDRQTVSSLPLGRSYAGMLQLAPGVPDNRDYAPNAGGNRQDNVYLYDGANITNPLFGHLGANFSELDIQEMNIKRGALSAEFGRAAGMVTNAITKSGTNKLSGSLRFVYEPAGFTWKFRDPNIITKYNVTSPTFAMSGPIIKDRVWWYASGNLPRSKTTDRVNNLGPVPDSKFSANELFIKLSSHPNPQHQLMVSFRNNDSSNKNSGIGVNSHPSVASNDEYLDRIIYASWTWIITKNTYLDIKYDHVDEKSKSAPITLLGYQPSFDLKNLDKMGNFLTATGYIVGGATKSGQYVGGASYPQTQNYSRDEIKVVLSQYLDFPGHSHLIKVGFGYDEGSEFLDRIANGWGSISYNSKLPSYADPKTRPGFRAIYYPKQPAQDSKGRTYSIFAQDSATIADRLTITAGVLLNRDEYLTYGKSEFSFRLDSGAVEKRKFRFNFDKEIQPRIGFTLVLDKNVGDKFYANFGRYFCMDNKSIARAAAPQRIYQADAWFLLDGTLVYNAPRASETGKVILESIKPTYQDEFVVGYSRPITKKWFLDLWGQYRNVKNVIEDFPTVNRETNPSTYVYGNLDGSDNAFGALATRVYKAFTIQIQHPFSDKWSLSANYTLSRLSGNWDLDYAPGSQLFYASSIIEDGPGTYVMDPYRDGIMAGDRTHVVKVFGTWEFLPRTMLGGYLRYQSGAPWEAHGKDFWGYAGYYKYLEKAGTRRLKAWTNLDLQIYHTIPFGRFNGVIEARIMNVFNIQQVQSRDKRLDQPTFGNPLSYASPRKFVITFSVNF
jgi:hypothetical protein